MTDRTAAALTDATDVLTAITFYASRADIPLTPTDRLEAIGVIIDSWRSTRPSQTYAEHTAKAISRTVGSTGNSTGPHLRMEFIHDHVEASDAD
jgi:hypothetical protein